MAVAKAVELEVEASLYALQQQVLGKMAAEGLAAAPHSHRSRNDQQVSNSGVQEAMVPLDSALQAAGSEVWLVACWLSFCVLLCPYVILAYCAPHGHHSIRQVRESGASQDELITQNEKLVQALNVSNRYSNQPLQLSFTCGFSGGDRLQQP